MHNFYQYKFGEFSTRQLKVPGSSSELFSIRPFQGSYKVIQREERLITLPSAILPTQISSVIELNTSSSTVEWHLSLT